MKKLIWIAAAFLSLLVLMIAPVGAAQIYLDNPTGNVQLAAGLTNIPLSLYITGDSEVVDTLSMYLSVQGSAPAPNISQVLVGTAGSVFQSPYLLRLTFNGPAATETGNIGVITGYEDPDTGELFPSLRTLTPAPQLLATLKLNTMGLTPGMGPWQLTLTAPSINGVTVIGGPPLTAGGPDLEVTPQLRGGQIALIPEPSTFLLGAIAGALALPLLGLRRARAKRA